MRCLRTILNAARLPVEFQEVEYITGSGTQYIDTGYIDTENTGLSVQYKQLRYSAYNGFAGNNDISVGTITDVRAYYGTLKSFQILNDYTSIHTIEVNLKNSGFTYYDGNKRDWNAGTQTFNKNETIKIFDAGYLQTGNSSANVLIYNVKITEGSSLVRDFVPCYRKSDNVIGFYDLVNGVFYANAGTGDFIKGNDVNRVVSSIKSQFAYSILPSEYKQLEYIQSDGTQYIDTVVIGNQNTNTEAKFVLTELTQNNNILSAYGSSSNTRSYLISSSGTNYLRLGYGSELQSSSIIAEINTEYIFKTNITSTSQEIIVNNVSALTINTTQTFASSSLTIFANNNNGTKQNYSKANLYYLKIFDGTTLVRNFIPCYRTSDNEIGLYDRVNGVFYTNSGTGSFTAGGEVDSTIISSNTLKLSTSRLPEIYQEVEYIESTGTQYIDTGVSPDNGTGLKVIFSDLTVATRDFNFIGSRLQGSSRFMINYANGNFGYGWDGYYTTNENINISMKNTAELNFYNNRHFIANGNTLANLSTIAISNMPTIYIFGQHSQANNLYSYKVYECEITQDDLLICKFIPCYRKSDNEIGLYDAKNGVFYTNAGTGTFIKGNNI